MKKSLIIGGPGSIEDSISSLSRALFRGDLEEIQIRQIPAQRLYYALKVSGLQSALDVLEVITTKQYASLLDFEFWTKDSFREDRFWTWLETIDDSMSLLPIQKFLASIDTSVLAFIIKKYVDVVYHEEPDDLPPGPNFYTPDAGSTWLSIKTHDPERHRLFGKLLAFMYQTNIELFYRILVQAGEGTSIEFEEIGFNEKTKRLEAEDIPAFSEAEPYHRALAPTQMLKDFDETMKRIIEPSDNHDISPKNPNFFSSVRFQPFLSALEEVSDQRLYEIQNEISRILNCAVVFFLNDFGEEDQLQLLSDQVFGVINVGLQILAKERPDIISSQGLAEVRFSEIYRIGLSSFYNLRKLAQKVPEDIISTLAHMNEPLALILECAKKNLPCVPSFFREDGTFEVIENRMNFKFQPIYSLQQIESVKDIIMKQVIDKSKEIRSYESIGKKHALSANDISQEPQ